MLPPTDSLALPVVLTVLGQAPSAPTELPAWLEVAPVDGARARGFGLAVHQSGPRLFVGAPGSNAVHVYLWDEESGSFRADGVVAGPQGDFGAALAGRDGRVVVSAPREDTPVAAAGCVYVFDPEDDEREPERICFGDRTNQHLGLDLLDWSGRIALIGAHDPKHPRAFLTTPGAGARDWGLELLLRGADSVAGLDSWCGGETWIASGAPTEEAARGRVLTLEHDGRTFHTKQWLTAPEATTQDRFGAALASVGARLLVGAPGRQGGRVFEYQFGTAAWIPRRNPLAAPTETRGFGAKLAVAGGLVLIGDERGGLWYRSQDGERVAHVQEAPPEHAELACANADWVAVTTSDGESRRLFVARPARLVAASEASPRNEELARDSAGFLETRSRHYRIHHLLDVPPDPSLVALAECAYESLSASLGELEPGEPLDLYYATDVGQMLNFGQPTLGHTAGWHSSETGAAFLLGGERGFGEQQRTLLHELTHQFQHRLALSPGQSFPRSWEWFLEGLAEHMERTLCRRTDEFPLLAWQPVDPIESLLAFGDESSRESLLESVFEEQYDALGPHESRSRHGARLLVGYLLDERASGYRDLLTRLLPGFEDAAPFDREALLAALGGPKRLLAALRARQAREGTEWGARGRAAWNAELGSLRLDAPDGRMSLAFRLAGAPKLVVESTRPESPEGCIGVALCSLDYVLGTLQVLVPGSGVARVERASGNSRTLLEELGEVVAPDGRVRIELDVRQGKVTFVVNGKRSTPVKTGATTPGVIAVSCRAEFRVQ